MELEKKGKYFYNDYIKFYLKNSNHIRIIKIDAQSYISGTEILYEIEKYAKENSINEISLIDGSCLEYYDSKEIDYIVNLAHLFIMRTGHSWYNKFGYLSNYYVDIDVIFYDFVINHKYDDKYINRNIKNPQNKIMEIYQYLPMNATIRDVGTWIYQNKHRKDDQYVYFLIIATMILKKYINYGEVELIKILK